MRGALKNYVRADMHIPSATEVVWAFRATPSQLLLIEWVGGRPPRLFRLGDSATLRSDVEQLVEYLIADHDVAGPLGRLPPALVTPVADVRKRTALILPDDALWRFPFALSFPQETTPRAPTLLLSLLADARGPSSAPRPLLAVGQPSFATPFGNPAERAVSNALLPLTASGPEIESALRAMYPGGAPDDARLVGEHARTVELMRLPLDQYRTMLFATHASTDIQRDMDRSGPGLYLSFDPGAGDLSLWLDREIARAKLDAEVVVLSACRTGPVAGERGPGLAGLAGAFLFAGARAVVATLWDVPDEAARLMTSAFFAAIAQGADPAVALAQAHAAGRAERPKSLVSTGLVLLRVGP